MDMYGPTTEPFLDGLGDLVSAEDAATLRACVPALEAGVVAVDWQTLSLGLPARDVSYFLATSLAVAERRAHERALAAAYHDALVTHGVVDYPAELCWDDYVFATPQGPLVAVFGCAYGTRTERGDRMFAAMVARSCAAIRDLGSLTLAQ